MNTRRPKAAVRHTGPPDQITALARIAGEAVHEAMHTPEPRRTTQKLRKLLEAVETIKAQTRKEKRK